MTGKTETISLIGAGLNGPLLALGLVKRGFQVEIYERRPDMRRVRIERRALDQSGAVYPRNSRPHRSRPVGRDAEDRHSDEGKDDALGHLANSHFSPMAKTKPKSSTRFRGPN